MDEKDKGKMVQVRLKWGSAEDLDTIYVNHLNITHSGPEFYLTFGELPLPPIMSEEEISQELEIKPVVRLAITPDAMKSIANAIQINMERYLLVEEEKL